MNLCCRRNHPRAKPIRRRSRRERGTAVAVHLSRSGGRPGAEIDPNSIHEWIVAPTPSDKVRKPDARPPPVLELD